MHQPIPNSNDSTDWTHREKTAQTMWVGFILAFFVIQAILWSIAITLTLGDKSHAILPDYDREALNWDEQITRQQASEQLGWQAQFEVDPESDIRGNRVIRLYLSDRDEKPIAGAHVGLRAFHRGRAGDPQILSFEETQDGVYQSQIRVVRSGRWNLSGSATRLGQQRLIEQELLLKATR